MHSRALPAEIGDYPVEDLESVADMPRYQAWVLSHFQEFLKGQCLELGAGTGTMSRHLLPHVDRLAAVEPSARCVALLTTTLAETGAVVHHQTLERHMAEAADASQDCVVMFNVLEHIDDDEAVLAECRRVLRPGGHLLVFVPALPLLYSPVDRWLGHHRRYWSRDLLDKATRARFQIVRCSYFDLIGAVAWGVLYTLLRRQPASGGLTRLFDRVLVPLSRRIESWASLPFGKNLVLVARAAP
ncbi:class I SAM-dependent methyltransferase [Azospirillum sp. sgz301742]